MKRINLEQLKAAPNGTMFTRCDASGHPFGGVYVWQGVMDDPFGEADTNPMFGYAVHLVPNGTGGDWEDDEFDDIASRFYFREDFDFATGDELFYVYTPDDLNYFAMAANRAAEQNYAAKVKSVATKKSSDRKRSGTIEGFGTSISFG